MNHQDSNISHLERLRKWKGPYEADLSLRFLKKQFKQDIEKPYRQLKSIVTLWQQLVEPKLAAHTRLETFRRGVLRVSVASSARLYELDRVLRGGLEHDLISLHKGSALRRVKLQVDTKHFAQTSRRQ